MDLLELARNIGLQYIPFLFALCFHEYAHGFVAKMKGDRTAEMMGRLTLNPMAHIDPIGTVLLPLLAVSGYFRFFFGWAKPVPVNERNLRNPRADMFWVALAGPLSNLLLAVVSVFALVIARQFPVAKAIKDMLEVFIIINLSLAFFNLLPIHPLDGGKVVARFLSPAANQKLEESQGILNIILIFLMISGLLKFLSYPILWTYSFLFSIAQSLVG